MEPYSLGVSDHKERRAPEGASRLHLRPMHPGDRLGPIPDGVSCAACAAGVPAGPSAVRAPFPPADMCAMRDHLADWHGDLRGLLAGGL